MSHLPQTASPRRRQNRQPTFEPCEGRVLLTSLVPLAAPRSPQLVEAATSSGLVSTKADRINLISQPTFPGGPTYGQAAETFFASTVFPAGASYKGVSVTRDNVIAERVETNGRGGWYVTVRARYSGRLFGVPIAAERVRVAYDNGGITVDLGGIKGAINTRSLGRWIQDTLQPAYTRNNPEVYQVNVNNDTKFKLKVYVHYKQASPDTWKSVTYSFAPGERARIDAQTKNRFIYFRAENGSGLVWAGSPTKNINFNGKTLVMRELDMGGKIGSYTYRFV